MGKDWGEQTRKEKSGGRPDMVMGEPPAEVGGQLGEKIGCR